jgi:hypothetical protein
MRGLIRGLCVLAFAWPVGCAEAKRETPEKGEAPAPAGETRLGRQQKGGPGDLRPEEAPVKNREARGITEEEAVAIALRHVDYDERRATASVVGTLQIKKEVANTLLTESKRWSPRGWGSSDLSELPDPCKVYWVEVKPRRLDGVKWVYVTEEGGVVIWLREFKE